MSRIVDTDNYAGDYPNEKFIGPRMSRQACEAVAYIINKEAGPDHPRYFKVVEDDYVLAPGFEP